ncbi:MAG: hypothetical protein AAGJ32_00080 [Pseudomonadota bacterium]
MADRQGDTTSGDDRIIALVEAYGAEPAAWPEADRHAGNLARLADPSPALLRAIDQSGHLDDLLDTLDQPLPANDLAQRIMAHAPSKPWRRRLASSIVEPSPWLSVSGALASLMVGLIIGVNTTSSAGAEYQTTEEDVLIYGALGLDDDFAAFSPADDEREK